MSIASAPIPLPDDLSLCHQLIHQLHDSLHQVQRRNEQLEHRLGQLLKARYGPKADRLDPGQLMPFAARHVEAGPPQPQTAGERIPENESPAKGKGHGRRPLPRELPRQQVA
jgi:hypothetical protein